MSLCSSSPCKANFSDSAQILDERKSSFCKPGLFLEHEFHAFGYWNDIKYWYQVGYGAKYSPYLGVG